MTQIIKEYFVTHGNQINHFKHLVKYLKETCPDMNKHIL